jgi:DNA-binding NtrC family response regulator
LPRQTAGPDQLRDYIRRHGLIQDDTGTIVGQSKPLLLALRAARRAAATRQNILIRGERGVGKELIARYIYLQGRKDGNTPFVVVNSAALAPTLFASELFGIKRRIATGVDPRDGFISTANHGDLFFDEIRDMSPECQAGVLRVLEDRTMLPVGGREPVPVDVRFLSATNVDVEALAATGRFRPDLLDRLREGGTMVLPPLRDRKEDIPALVEKFVRDAEKQLGTDKEGKPKAMRREVDDEVLRVLSHYDWPGNVRELRASVFAAVTNNPDVEHLHANHIRILVKQPANDANLATDSSRPVTLPALSVSSGDLGEILRTMSSTAFDPARRTDLARKLPTLQAAYAQLVAQYLKAALIATSRATPQNPEGEILIHPAIKLITGDESLTASKAADVVKRLLGICPEILPQLLADPILKGAYDTALRLRPKQSRPKKREKLK